MTHDILASEAIARDVAKQAPLIPSYAIRLIRFRATEAIESTDPDKEWSKGYFALKNALSDILAVIRETEGGDE